MLVGDRFLRAMSLTDLSLRLGGGIVLFLIALRMIFPHPDGPFGGDVRGGEPLIVPLAIPALAGPSALATVMLLNSHDAAVGASPCPLCLVTQLSPRERKNLGGGCRVVEFNFFFFFFFFCSWQS